MGFWEGKNRKKDPLAAHFPNLFAHFEPMLGHPPRPETEQNITFGLGFGQSNAFGHLLKSEVGERMVVRHIQAQEG